MKNKNMLFFLSLFACVIIISLAIVRRNTFKQYLFENLKSSNIKSVERFDIASYYPLEKSEDIEKLCNILSRIKFTCESEYDEEYFITLQIKYGFGREGQRVHGEKFKITPKVGKDFTIEYYPFRKYPTDLVFVDTPGEDYEYRYVSIEKGDKKIYYEVDKSSWEILDELESFEKNLVAEFWEEQSFLK